jgi:hypothetical protein
MTPQKLKDFLSSLTMDEADDIDVWLDETPDALDQMREITFNRSTEGSRITRAKDIRYGGGE